jgi:hypothetical protein
MFKYYGKRQGKLFWFWFRVFGVGASVKNTQKTFSERYGYTKCWEFFGLTVTILKKGAI